MEVARHWHETNWGVFRTGVALLSRFPIAESEYHEFGRHQFWDYKGYLRARVLTPAGPLTVYSVHLASTEDAEIKGSELAELSSDIRERAKQGPVLILGDFNEDVRSRLLNEFIASVSARSLYTLLPQPESTGTWTPWYWDRCDSTAGQTLDHVLLVGSQLAFAGGRIVLPELKPHPSDHCPVAADVRLMK
jgi:endonuclease/exonuclease/phosphatase family metal-dependent hydrolase